MDMLWILSGIAWFAVGVVSFRRTILAKPVDPIGDALFGAVLLCTGPLGLAICLACEADMKRHSPVERAEYERFKRERRAPSGKGE